MIHFLVIVLAFSLCELVLRVVQEGAVFTLLVCLKTSRQMARWTRRSLLRSSTSATRYYPTLGPTLARLLTNMYCTVENWANRVEVRLLSQAYFLYRVCSLGASLVPSGIDSSVTGHKRPRGQAEASNARSFQHQRHVSGPGKRLSRPNPDQQCVSLHGGSVRK